MEKHIKISIGIPVYNVEKYIEKSLTSALEQDFSLPYEIIVVDDRGTDGSMGIVKRIVESHERGNIVRVIQHENNKGLGEARNTIINNAKGKYLFFLDSDDWMMENALAVLYKVAEESQSEITCGSTLQEMEATGKQSVYFQYADAVYEHEAVGAWMIAHGIWIATTAWNKLYRIDFLRKYDIRTIHRICEDQWFSYMSWLYAKKIALLSEVTLCYNIRTASIMTSMYGKKGTDESARTCCDIINRLRKIIKEQFPNTFGTYDLYYKAIKANLNILLCSVYSEQQKRYIALQLKNAVKDVPSICSLHTTRYRFIYLCSLIFDNMFSFYRYDKWYSMMFGKPRSLIHNIPYIMNKVLFVSHEASRTGAPLVLLSLVKAAASLSTPPHKPCVLFLEEGPVIEEFKSYAKVFQIDAHHGWRKLIPYKLRLLVNRGLFILWAKRQHFDFVYANTVGSLAEGIELKNCLNIPLWLHIHETERTCRRRKITQGMMQQCDSFISVSSLSTHALLYYGVSQDKIQLVRPFSEHLSNTDIEPIKLDGVDESTFVIGLSGVGGWRKGSDIFPMIVRRLVDKYPQVPCKFIWLGGLNKSETPYDIEHLGIANYVITPGLVSNPMEYYKRFDVFLLASREDPFPLVCMENAALGNPIVMFEGTSGIADLVLNEKTGLQVPYLDVDAMCDAIYRLYSDKKLRFALGNNLRDCLTHNFSKEKSIGQLLKLLERDN